MTALVVIDGAKPAYPRGFLQKQFTEALSRRWQAFCLKDLKLVRLGMCLGKNFMSGTNGLHLTVGVVLRNFIPAMFKGLGREAHYHPDDPNIIHRLHIGGVASSGDDAPRVGWAKALMGRLQGVVVPRSYQVARKKASGSGAMVS